jgi:hypothetical protein
MEFADLQKWSFVPNSILPKLIPIAEIRFVVTEAISISAVEILSTATARLGLRTEATESEDMDLNHGTHPHRNATAIGLLPTVATVLGNEEMATGYDAEI